MKKARSIPQVKKGDGFDLLTKGTIKGNRVKGGRISVYRPYTRTIGEAGEERTGQLKSPMSLKTKENIKKQRRKRGGGKGVTSEEEKECPENRTPFDISMSYGSRQKESYIICGKGKFHLSSKRAKSSGTAERRHWGGGAKKEETVASGEQEPKSG